MANIELRKISKTYGRSSALSGLDISLSDGEFFVLLGDTGAGKTTTLRLIAGLEKPDAGDIFIDGANVGSWSAAERDVALVLQQYSLYPRLTVRENLEFPLRSRMRRMSDADIARQVDRVSATLRITHLLDRKTDRLSGGEMQRVSIGRAIVRRPRVFLMDEPLSALDAKLREALRTELKLLQAELGATFLYVTHDQVEAMSMGDRIGVLDRGMIVQTGAPREIYRNPKNTFVARAVGAPAINLLEGEVSQGRAIVVPGVFEIPLPAAGMAAEGRRLIFGIRPEDIRLNCGGVAAFTVTDVEDLGVEKILTLVHGTHAVKATAPSTFSVSRGQTVSLGAQADAVTVFDRESGINLKFIH